jgi:hypothetical protein
LTTRRLGTGRVVNPLSTLRARSYNSGDTAVPVTLNSFPSLFGLPSCHAEPA